MKQKFNLTPKISLVSKTFITCALTMLLFSVTAFGSSVKVYNNTSCVMKIYCQEGNQGTFDMGKLYAGQSKTIYPTAGWGKVYCKNRETGDYANGINFINGHFDLHIKDACAKDDQPDDPLDTPDNTPSCDNPDFNSPCNDVNILDFSENGYDWGLNDMAGSYTVNDQTFDISMNDPDGIFAAFQDVQVDPDDEGSYENNTGIAVGINPHQTDDELEITYNLSLVSDYVAFTIRDLDSKYYGGSQQIEEVCVFGYLNGVAVQPTITSLCGSVDVSGNCAVGTTNSNSSNKDESIRVVFEECINEIKIVYGNAVTAAADPTYSRIFIGDDIGFGTAVCSNCNPCTAEASEIAMPNGNTVRNICIDDEIEEPVEVLVTGGNGENSAWVITDQNAIILDLPDGPPFIFDDADEGTCLIWYLNWDGDLAGTVEVGANAADIVTNTNAEDPNCAALSNFIEVNRENCCTAEASTIELASGDGSICTNDGVEEPIEVNVTGGNGDNSAWVITDENAIILDLPAGPPFILDDAGEGTCSIWYLNWEGELNGTLEIGANAATLVTANDDSVCAELSNPIDIVRENCCSAEASQIELASGDGSICVDDGIEEPIEVNVTGGNGENSAWIITDQNANILSLPLAPPFNLDDAGEGTCLIWYLNWDGELNGTLEIGANVATLIPPGDDSVCAQLSESIAITREVCCTAASAEITIAGIGNIYDVCVNDSDLPLEQLEVVNAGGGANSAWVITDENNIILELSNEVPSLDFYANAEGTCLVWYLTWDGELANVPQVGDDAGALATNSVCAELSNSITINKTCCCPFTLQFDAGNLDCVAGSIFPKPVLFTDSTLIYPDTITLANGSQILADSLACYGMCSAPEPVVKNEAGVAVPSVIFEPGTYIASTACLECLVPVELVVTQADLDGCSAFQQGIAAPSICNGGMLADAPIVNSVYNNSATIKWNAQTNASLQYKATDSDQWISVTQSSGFVIIPNLGACKEYETRLNYPCNNEMITSLNQRFTTAGCVGCDNINPQIVPLSVTDNSAILSWDVVPGTIYTLHYRSDPNADWKTYNTVVPFVVLFGLDECSTYEFGLKVTCSNARSSNMSAIVELGNKCDGQKTGSLLISDNSLINIYPNPASSFVDISLTNDATISAIDIYNVSGKLIFNQSDLNYDGMKYTAKLNNLAKGLYFITATVEGKVHTKKFLKE